VRVTLTTARGACARLVEQASLVVVVESPTSDAAMHAIFQDLDKRLSKHPEVGEYDQEFDHLPLRRGRCAKQIRSARNS